MDVDEAGGLVPGYELKLNSYDLGVDIEFYDAVQRLRFEHPEVKVVVVTSGREKVFCAEANIRMLAASSHSWKVNFCKFTNETRNSIEGLLPELVCHPERKTPGLSTEGGPASRPVPHRVRS
jgi:benzoyl-CoA-dihydrodiol lyase